MAYPKPRRADEPLGIYLNNPGNIEQGAPWQGLAEHQAHPRFCTFTSPSYGIRAIARVLITYQDERRAKDGSPIDTVQEIIDRWAPPAENDSSAYAAHVRDQMGLVEGEKVNVHEFSTLRELVKAIITHENGQQPYTDAQITKGLVLAGVEPPEQDLQKSRTVKGGKAVGIGIVLTAAQEVLEPLKEQVAWLSAFDTRWATWGAVAIAALGLAAILWARIDDKRKGLR